VGKAGVWGVNENNQVYYRVGTYDDPKTADGTDWQLMDGKQGSLHIKIKKKVFVSNNYTATITKKSIPWW
jgi:hypothetical protein